MAGGRLRCLVIGASGFIGSALTRQLGPERSVGTYFRHPIPNGIRFDARTTRLRDLRLGGEFTHGIILLSNTTIDECARRPRASWGLNVRAVIDIIDDLRNMNAVPVFTSSDAVFDGRAGGYTEEDPRCPILTYGHHKAAVESYLEAIPGPRIIVRLSKAVGIAPGNRNLIGEWLNALKRNREIACAHDQHFSPAFVEDVASAIIELGRRRLSGLFNMGGPRAMSRLELLRMLIRNIQQYPAPPFCKPLVRECSIRDFPFAEPRPVDTSLVSAKLYSAIGRTFTRMEEVCISAALAFSKKRATDSETTINGPGKPAIGDQDLASADPEIAG